ncbi:MAG: kelch repeat-containing protein [Myxococcaceae bacterium]
MLSDGRDDFFRTPGDTWEYDGTHWQQITPVQTPVPRYLTYGYFDTALAKVISFGGIVTGGQDYRSGSIELRTWDGSTWGRPTLAVPTLSTNASGVYDPVRQRTVFLGSPAWNSDYATWEWDGSKWAGITLSPQPSMRQSAAMVFDDALGKSVLFGGCDFVAYQASSETWLYDGASWTQVALSGASPGARCNAMMAYDARRKKVVLFGGRDATAHASFDDTWEFDGTTWTQLAPAHSPPLRMMAAMTYDTTHGQVVLFGGADGISITFDDTWTFDGSDWTQQVPAHTPRGRWGSTLANDTLGRGVLMVAGCVDNPSHPFDFGTDDVWWWNGSDWSELPMGRPSHHCGSAAVVDPAHGQLVMAGGSGSIEDGSSDLWLLPLLSSSP